MVLRGQRNAAPLDCTTDSPHFVGEPFFVAELRCLASGRRDARFFASLSESWRAVYALQRFVALPSTADVEAMMANVYIRFLFHFFSYVKEQGQSLVLIYCHILRS